jgi:hypothetical protein
MLFEEHERRLHLGDKEVVDRSILLLKWTLKKFDFEGVGWSPWKRTRTYGG